jgi:hypothetical protein
MANPRIEVEIGANVVGLTNGVNTATGQLDKLGKAAQATAPQIQRLGQATQGYNSVGIDFARIIQDAPFGIIGVGNNITQLAGSFQVLKNSTGSTGAALKSALGSILSSGNALVLGISILTTVFTVLQQKGFFKTEEAAKSLSDQLEEFRENLDGIAKATLQGQINAQKEISNYKLLQVQAENTTLSLEKRIAAVNELRKLAPEYLKNLTDEQILTGNVGDAYKSLTNDILALAKAKAFSAQIDKNTSESLTLLLQEEQRAIEISKKLQDQEKARREDEQRRAIGAAAGGFGSAAISEAASIESKIKDLIDEQVTSAQERARLAEQNLKLEAGIVGFNSQGATFAKVKTDETKKNVTANEEIKRSLEEIQKIEFNRPAISFQATAPVLPGIDMNNVQSQINGLKSLEQSLQGTGLTIADFYASIAAGAAEGFDSLDTFIGRIADTRALIENSFALLQQNANEAFTDLGASIGEALGNGTSVLKAVGSSLLASVGNLLGDFGKQLIAFGVAGLAYSSLIKSIFTDPITAAPKAGLAIAAGVALVAISGAIGSSMKKNSGSGGGGGGGSSVGGSGVGGGSSFTGGAQGGMFAQNRDVSGEFVVRGNDLVYVLGQANNKINKG